MPSRGHARGPQGDLRLVRAPLRPDVRSGDAKRSSRSARRRGSRTCLLAIVGPGDCVLSPDPCYPIHRFGVIIAGGEPVPVADAAPGCDRLRGDRGGARARAAQAEGPDRQLPAQPDQRRRRARPSSRRWSRWRKRESLWVISDLAYADLVHDGRPAPSIFQVPGARELAVEFFTVSKSYSMPGWRVGFCVGNRTLVGALGTHQGLPRLRDVRARRSWRRRRRSRSCDADVAANRALYKHRAALLCDGLADGRLAGAAARPPRCSSGRRCRRAPRSLGRGGVRDRAAREGARRRRLRASASAPAARATSASRWSRPTSAPAQACAAIGAYLRTT